MHGRFLRTRLKKRKWSSWKTDQRYAIRQWRTAADSKAKGKKQKKTKDLHAACLVNSCQGKDAGVLFSLNYQFINTLALDVIQVLDSRNYFLSC